MLGEVRGSVSNAKGGTTEKVLKNFGLEQWFSNGSHMAH